MKDDIMVPEGVRIRVKDAYSNLGFDEDQSVKKIPLHAYRIEDRLMIDPIGGEMGVVGAAAGVGPITLTLEMGQSIMLRLNRSDQRMSQFQAQVQA
jgi:hypothetical protein